MQKRQVPVLHERAEKNKRFKNDGSYESIQLQLHSLARKAFSRVQRMGLPMTYDDVVGEMNLTYVQARARWDEGKGVLFSTYFQTCCYQNFNNSIRRMETDRRTMGMVPMSDMLRPDGDDDSGSEFAICEDGERYGVLAESGGFNTDPSVALERKQNALHGLKRMSGDARKVVHALIKAVNRELNDKSIPETKLRVIMQELNLSPAKSRAVKAELELLFDCGLYQQRNKS